MTSRIDQALHALQHARPASAELLRRLVVDTLSLACPEADVVGLFLPRGGERPSLAWLGASVPLPAATQEVLRRFQPVMARSAQSPTAADLAGWTTGTDFLAAAPAELRDAKRALWATIGVTDELRLRIYSDGAYVGVAYVLTRSGTPYTRAHAEALGPLVEPLRRAVIGACRAEAGAWPDSPGEFVFRDQTVVEVGPGSEAWLKLPGVVACMSRAVTAHRRGQHLPPCTVDVEVTPGRGPGLYRVVCTAPAPVVVTSLDCP